MSATPIEISVGGSRWASSWAQDLMTWEDFTESLSARMYNNASTETHAEYMALSKAEQDKRQGRGRALWAGSCGTACAAAAAAPGAA